LCNPQHNHARHFSDSGVEDSTEIVHSSDQSQLKIHYPFRKQRDRSSSSLSLPDQSSHATDITKSKQSATYSRASRSRLESSSSIDLFYSQPSSAKVGEELPDTLTEMVADAHVLKQNLHSKKIKNQSSKIQKCQQLVSNVQVSSQPSNSNRCSCHLHNTLNCCNSYRFKTATSVWEILHNEKVEKMALEQCLSVITTKMDAVILHPLLCSKGLLTDINSLFLLNETRPDEEKACYLVAILPKKQEGWFQAFLDCLQCSTRGTGHDMVHKALISKYNELTSTNSPDTNSTMDEVTSYNTYKPIPSAKYCTLMQP